MTSDDQLYMIGLTLVKGIGNVLARQLIQYFDGAKPVFSSPQRVLEKVPGIGEYTAVKIKESESAALKRAEKELLFIEKNKIDVYSIADERYPLRLSECHDAPIVFYYKGAADINAKRIISIVGTRNATEYGRSLTESLIKDLSQSFPDILIVSGLAYGIDICSHRCALKTGLPTVGVLAHGLDRIYPALHRNTAAEMLKNGGLLTDFMSETNPDRENFLQRNRIIAGLADATIIVESAEKGGALVTADIAFSYGRDVYTYPGRVTDKFSKGCNRLVQLNKAGLITSAHDLISAMCWDVAEKRPQQLDIPFTEKPDHPILTLLSEKGEFHINELAALMNLPVHHLSPMLFELELAGHIQALPGGMYKLKT
ncbi:MAG: DNA-processing protein DprA [Tannerella sp.]|jgi:DNA processing protein|nr:DNA-processing protein DprA [Tannerella sp.]